MHRQGKNATRLAAELRRRAADRLLELVVHDLRNALMAAKLSAGALSATRRRPPRRSRSDLEVLRRSLRRMDRLVSDLGDARQVALGTFTVDAAAALPPVRLIESAVEDAAETTREHPILIDCAPGLPPVPADEGRIAQVFANLIGNAVKFSEPGAAIVVGARLDGGGQVAFFVRDRGPGMSADERSHVFDRYWQAEPGRRPGSGLGLTICRAIVEAHGGAIAVESRTGEGSTFLFTLPPARSDGVARVVSAPPRLTPSRRGNGG
jgi:signal transduction histidine kinase